MVPSRGRGRLIAIGMMNSRDAPTIKTRRVVAAWALQVFLTLIGVVLFNSASLADFRHLLNGVGAILLPLSWFVFVINPLGVEVDGIYEAGVSSRKASLWETATGRGFQPYSEIAIVGRVSKSERRPDGLVLRVNGGKSRIGPFWDEYVNDFFRMLESKLVTSCPAARWIEVSVEESLVRSQVSWRKARRK